MRIWASNQKPLKKLPKHVSRPSLFWDTNPATIDPQKNARYIIERVLDFGTDAEVRWLWRTYNHVFLGDVVERSRVLRAQTRSLWSLMAKGT